MSKELKLGVHLQRGLTSLGRLVSEREGSQQEIVESIKSLNMSWTKVMKLAEIRYDTDDPKFLGFSLILFSKYANGSHIGHRRVDGSGYSYYANDLMKMNLQLDPKKGREEKQTVTGGGTTYRRPTQRKISLNEISEVLNTVKESTVERYQRLVEHEIEYNKLNK